MKAIVTGDAEYVAQSFDNLPPGAHVAVRTSPTQLPDSGIALRLAGFEIRDTIAHVVGDRIVWWILARKPLDGTVAANVLAHGVGGLNIDASRVGTSGGGTHCGNRDENGKCLGHSDAGKSQSGATFHADESNEPSGRFPANVLLDEHAATEMDRQSGWQKDGTAVRRNRKNSEANPNGIYRSHVREAEPDQTFGSGGGASRFFPVLNKDEAENWIRRLIDPDYHE